MKNILSFSNVFIIRRNVMMHDFSLMNLSTAANNRSYTSWADRESPLLFLVAIIPVRLRTVVDTDLVTLDIRPQRLF